MKENINEHDMTKKMMSIIRGFNKSLIKEDDAPVTTSAPSSIEKGDDLPERTAEPPSEGPLPKFPVEGYNKLDKDDERFKKISNDIEAFKLGIRVTSVYVKPKTEDFAGDVVITGIRNVDDENKYSFSLSYTKGIKDESIGDGKMNSLREELNKALNGYLENLQTNTDDTEEELFYDVKK